MKTSVFEKLSLCGAVQRDRLKNDLDRVEALRRQGFLQKVYKRGRVFFELTEKALPLLDHVRLKLLEEAKLRFALYPRRKHFYQALLEDVSFFDTSNKEAEDFLFLGDWRLNRPPTKSQLK